MHGVSRPQHTEATKLLSATHGEVLAAQQFAATTTNEKDARMNPFAWLSRLFLRPEGAASPQPTQPERKESRIGARLKKLRDDAADQVMDLAEGKTREVLGAFQLGQVQQRLAADMKHHMDVCTDQQRQLRSRRPKDVSPITQAFFHLDTTAEELAANLAYYADKLQLPNLRYDLGAASSATMTGGQQQAGVAEGVVDADPPSSSKFASSQPGASQFSAPQPGAAPAVDVEATVAPDGRAVMRVDGRDVPESALMRLSTLLEQIYRGIHQEVEGARTEVLLHTSPRATELVAVARRVRRIVPQLEDARAGFIRTARESEDTGVMRAIRGLLRISQR